MSGRVVHFEVPVDDPDRAERFYAEVFGWSTQRLPDMGYTLVTTGPTGDAGPSEPGFVNGGMLARGALSAPVLTLEVDDIDEALAKVEEHGGTVVAARQTVGEMGFSAYVRDSEGNLTGLWQSAT